jgi:hypothetical protein
MSNGFVVMGQNLSELSNGISTMATEGSMFPDSSEALSSFKSNIEKEMRKQNE